MAQHPSIEILEVNTDEKFVKVRTGNIISIWRKVDGAVKPTSRSKMSQTLDRSATYIPSRLYSAAKKQVIGIMHDRF